MIPRPILKHFPQPLCLDATEEYASHPDLFTPYSGALPFSSSRNIPPLESPHVHFPPTPILTQMGMTHSSYSYDRHPIEVMPNSLALPQRGAREVDEPVDDSEMRTSHCDDGYFPPSEHLDSIADVESSEPSSSRKSLLFDTETSTISSYPVQMIPFENIQNHSRNLTEVYVHSTHPTVVLAPSAESPSEPYASLPSSELSASISISIHFSRLSNHSHHHTSPSNLTRKRDPDECHFDNGKKTKAHRKHHPRLSDQYFHEESLPEELDEDSSDSPSGVGIGYDLGLGHILNRTKHSMDTIISDSSGSTSVCGTHFASFCDPGLEGCLGGF